MTRYKSKNIISWVISIFIGYIAVRIFFWIIGAGFFAFFTFAKFIIVIIMISIIALPLYVIIKKMFIK